MPEIVHSPFYFSLILAGVSFLTVALLGNPYIAFLRRRYMGQYIREDGPQSHQSKKGTPTLGGLLIGVGALAGFVAFYLLDPVHATTRPIWITVLIGLVFGGLGFADDYLKIAKKHNKGLTGYSKLAVQVGLGLVVGLYMLSFEHSDITVFFHSHIELGLFYPVFAAIVITGTSNAVNITDGLDGLASSTVIVSLIASALLLNITGFPELSLFCAILIGACAGFLLFNRNPARIFMGDTGSLALGGLLGVMMVLGDADLWLVPVGAIFVLEALSVIIQVVSFKSTGKRVFKMAPLHHHFELCGLKETQVVWLFLAIQALICGLALWYAYRV